MSHHPSDLALRPTHRKFCKHSAYDHPHTRLFRRHVSPCPISFSYGLVRAVPECTLIIHTQRLVRRHCALWAFCCLADGPTSCPVKLNGFSAQSLLNFMSVSPWTLFSLLLSRPFTFYPYSCFSFPLISTFFLCCNALKNPSTHVFKMYSKKLKHIYT